MLRIAWRAAPITLLSVIVGAGCSSQYSSLPGPSPQARSHAPLWLRADGEAGPVAPAASEDGISVYFSPNGGCTAAILHEIDNAKESIFVQAAQFQLAP